MTSIPHDPTRPSPWAAGTIIGEKYRLRAAIGAGGMGQVWRAEHVSLGTPVAVKLVDLASAQNPQETMARFLHEARAAARIKNANVVQTIDHGSQGHVAYIVMEMLEGESLARRLGRVGTLPAADVVRIFREMARALEKAHAQSVVHRDLKPENVFLALEDGREIVKILDFGIAKMNDTAGDPILKTHAGVVLGTPAYMSPEQVLGKPLDHRSDLWQMALMAFECVTGQRAFSGNTLGELFMKICSAPMPVPSQVAHVPPGFDAWFARAAQRDPKDRFPSARELAETLAMVLLRGKAGGPTTLPMGGMRADVASFDGGYARTSRAAPPNPRLRAWPIALAVLPVLIAGLVGGVLILRGRGDAQATTPPAPLPSATAPLAATTNSPSATPSAAPPATPPATPPTPSATPATSASAAPGPGTRKATSPATTTKKKDDFGI